MSCGGRTDAGNADVSKLRGGKMPVGYRRRVGK